jgi:hypothetical protein
MTTKYTIPVELDEEQYRRLTREAERRGVDNASALAAVCGSLSGARFSLGTPSFEEARQCAFGLLGDAGDWLRGGDFRGEADKDDFGVRRELLREFFQRIGQAKTVLDELARTEAGR